MKEKCKSCIYSKSMHQPYPRKCVVCGTPEEAEVKVREFRFPSTILFQGIDSTEAVVHDLYVTEELVTYNMVKRYRTSRRAIIR